MTPDHTYTPRTFTWKVYADRRLAWLVILPVLALVAPVFAGFRTREVAAPAPNARSAIYFAAGTTQVRPHDTKILDAYVVWLGGEGKRSLVIEGHTDEPGDSAFSRTVGEQRAKAAKAYLVSRGVVAARVTTVSRGGGRPTCRETTPTCRALNRRATLATGVLP